jgi:hypothetical protein
MRQPRRGCPDSAQCQSDHCAVALLLCACFRISSVQCRLANRRTVYHLVACRRQVGTDGRAIRGDADIAWHVVEVELD